ncbi:MAG TPA: hypothetical protein VHH36_04690 [Candidatus Thermoplasmatota archaeon]|nr:hypothetical protein [Candidatus Thermoplasmatota archaeon]
MIPTSPTRFAPLAALAFAALALTPLAAADNSVGACNDFTSFGQKDCYGATLSDCAGNGTDAGVSHYAYDWLGFQSRPRCYASVALFDFDNGYSFDGVCRENVELLASGDPHAYCTGVIRDPSGRYCVGGWTWNRDSGTRTHGCQTPPVFVGVPDIGPIEIRFYHPLP